MNRALQRSILLFMGLTPRERAVLDFERRWWTEPGPKEQRIRERFDASPAQYVEELHALAERPEALEAEPLVVRRLRREAQRSVRARVDQHRASREARR